MRKPFLELVKERVVVIDGAMGSNLQIRPLELQRDWMGHENISEVLNFSRPDVIHTDGSRFQMRCTMPSRSVTRYAPDPAGLAIPVAPCPAATAPVAVSSPSAPPTRGS